MISEADNDRFSQIETFCAYKKPYQLTEESEHLFF